MGLWGKITGHLKDAGEGLINPKKWESGYKKLEGRISGRTAEQNAEKGAKNERDWQEYMSNTAHQREMADLEAAGLNPILTATGGSGATSGSGAAATSGQSPSENISALLNAMMSVKNAVTSAKTQKGNEKLIDQQIQDLQDQIQNRDTNTAKHVEELEASIEKMKAETLKSLEETKARRAQNQANEDLGLTDSDTGTVRTVARTKQQARSKREQLAENSNINAYNTKLKHQLMEQNKNAQIEFNKKVISKLTDTEKKAYLQARQKGNQAEERKYIRLAKQRGAF